MARAQRKNCLKKSVVRWLDIHVMHLEPANHESDQVDLKALLSKYSDDGIPAELLEILKDDAVKVLCQYTTSGKLTACVQNWKISIFL